MATRKEINVYLNRIREIHKIRIINVAKNRDTRLRLGITVDDQKNLIKSLTEKDYVSGPEKDKDKSRKGDIWIFKKYAFGTIFYIKIKFIEIKENGYIKALSCHIDNM